MSEIIPFKQRRLSPISKITFVAIVMLATLIGGMVIGQHRSVRTIYDQLMAEATADDPTSHALTGSDVPDHGVISAVIDGDSAHLNVSDTEYVVVRIAEIDAPERAQPYWWQATAALAEMIEGKDVRVVVLDKDRYGRFVSRLYVADVDVSAEMVRKGAAWFYSEYARDDSLYHIESHARDQKIGLWGLPKDQRMEPWEWRRNGRRRVTDF
jgi:endonuclease YncB( thermonuclease family)